MSNGDDLKSMMASMMASMMERQNAFEEQMIRLMQELVALRRDFQVQAAEEQRRWADVRADIRELTFESQRILRCLERQQQQR